VKFAFAPIELFGVNLASSTPQESVRNDRVQHFVVKDVFQIPVWDESLVQKRMNPNDAVLLLNRPENKVVFRPMFSPATPFHFVIPQPAAKIASVELIENRPQIEVFSFLAQIQLSLHRQCAIRDFPFCFFRHTGALGWKGFNCKSVQTGRQEKRPLFSKFLLIA
jgi:hypothetical protein